MQGFTRLWERICKDSQDFGEICKILDRGFARICDTLGEDLQGFMRLWERICKDLEGLHEIALGEDSARLWERIHKDLQETLG